MQRPVGELDPWRAPRCPWPRRRATCRSRVPVRWASLTASTSATRPVPRLSGSSPRRCAPRRRVRRPPACRSRRQRVPVQRIAVGVHRADPRDRHRGAAGRRLDPRGPPRSGRADGNAVVLVGQGGPGLAGSEYARLAGSAADDGPPALDLERERRLQAFIREAIDVGLVESCQDVSGGGLAVAIAEMATWGDRGATLRVGVGDSPAVALFGRAPRAWWSSACPRHVPALVLLARQPRDAGRELADRRRAAVHRARRRGCHRAPPRSAAAGSRTRSRSRSSTCATRGSTAGPGAGLGASRARWRRRAGPRRTTRPRPRCRASRPGPDVRRRRSRPAGRRARGGERRGDRPVRAPAPRPGVGGCRPCPTAAT